MHVIRWWVFEGDAWQIQKDASGAPNGVNAAVYADFDAALRIAQEHDLYYDFVLFSSPTAIPRPWVTSGAQRSKLAAALAPLLAHYATNPRILSWEVFNEPEWDIWNNHIDAPSVQATVRAVADAVHANSQAYVTVGAASIGGLPLWVGQHLDYYQAHWYDTQTGNECARCTDYATLRDHYGLDAPLVIGEFYAPSSVDAAQRFADFYDRGYAGAWPWSLFPDHTSDRFGVDLGAAQAFAAQRADLGPNAAAQPATPSSEAAATSAPSVPSPDSDVLAPRFVAGFATLKSLLGDVMGDPIEIEHTVSDGCDTQQLTTTGLAYWRCETNTPSFVAFPDGMRHWALTDGQLVQWVGPSPDPPDTGG